VEQSVMTDATDPKWRLKRIDAEGGHVKHSYAWKTYLPHCWCYCAIWHRALDVCWGHICLTEGAAHSNILFLSAMYKFFYLLTYCCYTDTSAKCPTVPQLRELVIGALAAGQGSK